MTDMQTTTGQPAEVDGAAFFQTMLNKEAGIEPEPATDDVVDDENDDAGEDLEIPDNEPEPATESVDEDESEADDVDESNAKTEGEDAYDMSQAIKVKLPDSGEESEVTLGELVKGYQRQQDYTRKTQELAEQKKALEEGLTQRKQLSERALQTENEINALSARHRSIVESLSQKDWQELRVNDPAQYAAIVADLQLIERQIEGKQKEKSAIEYHDEQEAIAAHKQKVAEGEKRLTSRIPEWSDPVKREALQTQILGYLEGLGYERSKLANLADPVAVEIAYNAMKYQEMMGSKKTLAAKKVTAAPKMLKPGMARNKTEKAADVRKAVMDRVRKTGSAVEYFNQYS